jgi:hypothetical protein
MKLFLVTCFSFLFSLALSGQEPNEFIIGPSTRTNHSFRDFNIAISPDLLFNTPNGLQLAGGIKAKMFLGKRFSFDADLVFGRNYIHGSLGIIGIPIWLLIPGFSYDSDETTFSELLTIGALMLLTAEHTSYNIPTNNNIDISPYVSLLRLRESSKIGDYNNPEVTNQQACFAAGLEINKYFKKFLLAPYAEYTIGYADHISGFNAGVYFGMYFTR